MKINANSDKPKSKRQNLASAVKFKGRKYYAIEVFKIYTYSSVILGTPNRQLNQRVIGFLKKRAREVYGKQFKILIKKPNYLYSRATAGQKWHLKSIKAENTDHLEYLPNIAVFVRYQLGGFESDKYDSISDLIVISLQSGTLL